MSTDGWVIRSILALPFPIHFPDGPDTDDLSRVFCGVTFPSLSPSQIPGRTRRPCDYRTVLQDTEFYFPLVPDILERLSLVAPTDADIIAYCSCFVLCSYLSWRMFMEYTCYTQYLSLIVDTIPLVMKSPFHPLGVAVYLAVVKFCLAGPAQYDMACFLPSLRRLAVAEFRGKVAGLAPICVPLLKSFFPPRFGDSDSRNARNFLDVLVAFADADADFYSGDVASGVITEVSSQIGCTELTPLRLLASLSCRLHEDEVVGPVGTFVNNFRDFVKAAGPFVELPPVFQKVHLPEAIENFSLSDFWSGSQIGRRVEIGRGAVRVVFFGDEDREKLECIAKASQFWGKAQSLFLICFKAFLDYQAGEVAFFHALTIFVSKSRLAEPFADQYWETVSESRVFSADVWMVQNDVWNQLRAEAIDAMIPSQFVGLGRFLERLLDRPGILGEVICRIPVGEVAESVLQSEKLLEVSVRIHRLFQSLHFQATDGLALDLIESTRFCLFKMVERVANFALPRPDVAQFYVGLLYEISMRELACATAKKFLLEVQPSDGVILFVAICDLFRLAVRNIRQKEFAQLAALILSLLQDVDDQKPFWAEKLNSLASFGIEELQNCSDCSCLAAVLRVSAGQELNEVQFDKIKAAVDRLRPADQKAIDTELYHMFTGGYSDDDVSHLIHPQLFDVLVSHCETDEDFAFFYNKMLGLTRRSIYNCLQARKSDLDMKLFEQIRTRPNSLILDVLAQIHSYASSQAVIGRYFDVEGGVRAMAKCLEMCSGRRAPSAYMSLDSPLAISEPMRVLDGYFEFVFVYRSEGITSTSYYDICSILNHQGQRFRILVGSSAVLIKIIQEKHSSTDCLHLDFPPGEWVKVAVGFSPADPDGVIEMRVDGEVHDHFNRPMAPFTDPMVHVTFGSERNPNLPIGYISQVALYPRPSKNRTGIGISIQSILEMLVLSL
jgi:hypothetical protein